MALLGLLHRLVARLELRLVVGHVDHGLRSTAPNEAALVREVAASLGHPCEVTRVHLAAGTGLAARARDARYEALGEQARAHGARFMVLGHTATDQLETMLLHLGRGAGLGGLGGMRPVSGDRLRPLLSLTREETRALAERMGLPFVDDPTNDDVRHPRVRMRAQVIPALERVHPGAARAAYDASLFLHDAADLVTAMAEALLETVAREGDTPSLMWGDEAGWRTHPRVVRWTALRAWLGRQEVALSTLGVRTLRAMDAAACEWDAHCGAPAGDDHARVPRGGPRPRRFDLHPGRCAVVDREGLRVVSAGPRGAPDTADF